MNVKPFKERVKEILIEESSNFKSIFVDYEYLILSKAFSLKDYYILSANEDNFQHLTGVNALVNPKEFFQKCYTGTLLEQDFNFIKRGQPEGAVKGSVRRKIMVLPDMMNLFNDSFCIQESFSKNQILCSFATSDGKLTVGFIEAAVSYPKTLLSGNELDLSKAKPVDLVLRKRRSDQQFSEVILGDVKYVDEYFHLINELISDSLLAAASAG